MKIYVYIAPIWFGLRFWVTSLYFTRQQMEDFTPLPLEMMLLKEMEVWACLWVFTWGVVARLWSTVNQATISRRDKKKGSLCILDSLHGRMNMWERCSSAWCASPLLLGCFPPCTDTCQNKEWLCKGQDNNIQVCHFLFVRFSEGLKHCFFGSFWPMLLKLSNIFI